jgi:hypothetical protein
MKIVSGILSFLSAIFILFVLMLSGDELEILSAAGYLAPYIFSAIFLIAAAVLLVFLRKQKLLSIIGSIAMFIGSAFGLIIFIALQIASSATGVDIAGTLGSDDFGQFIVLEGLISVVIAIFSVITLIASIKTKKQP